MNVDANSVIAAVVHAYNACVAFQANGIATNIVYEEGSEPLAFEVKFSVDFLRKGPLRIEFTHCLDEDKTTIVEGIHGLFDVTVGQTSKRVSGLDLFELIERTSMRSLELTPFLFELLLPDDVLETRFISRSAFRGAKLLENTHDKTMLVEGVNRIGEVTSLMVQKPGYRVRSYKRHFIGNEFDRAYPVEIPGLNYEKALELNSFHTTYNFLSSSLR